MPWLRVVVCCVVNCAARDSFQEDDYSAFLGGNSFACLVVDGGVFLLWLSCWNPGGFLTDCECHL